MMSHIQCRKAPCRDIFFTLVLGLAHAVDMCLGRRLATASIECPVCLEEYRLAGKMARDDVKISS